LKAQVHDSVLFQYAKDEPGIREEVLQSLDNPVIVHNRTLRIPLDIKVGNSWGDMNKLPRS